MRSPSVLALLRETSRGRAARVTVLCITWLVRVYAVLLAKPGLNLGTAIGSTKKNNRQNVNVIHAAPVVARRQYIPTQKTAANSIGTIHVSCRLANIS